MADRKTTESVDPVAQAAFKAKMKQMGRPAVRRAPVAPGAAKPSVMQTIWQSLDALAAALMGSRQSDASGIGGRRRGAMIEDQANAAQGLDPYGRPLK